MHQAQIDGKGFLMVTDKRDTKNWKRYRKGKETVGTWVHPQTKTAMVWRADQEGVSVAEWLRRVIARELTLTSK